MQKKIIALAVAGLVSGAAFAQGSNVTVYGIVDMGYQYSWDNVQNKAKSMSEVKSGGLDGSRVGVKGVEDLGNGLKAEFDATWAFGSDYNSTVTMGEGSSVALAGNFGKVRAGYFGTFLDDNTGVDASGRHGMINSGSLYGTGKYENFVAYISPNFSGFTAKAGFASNVGEGLAVDVAPLVGTGIANTRAYTAALSYENGPIKAGAAYATYRGQEASGYLGNNKSSSDWNAGVSYNFGVATVSLFGAQQKKGDAALPKTGYLGANYDKNTFWALGVQAPIGANDTIKAGYGRSKLKGVGAHSDDTANAWDIVYLHSLSKRTTAYAMYGNLNVDNVDTTAAQTTYQQAFNVGLRHTF